jgi:hypothetical protein
MLQNIVIKNFRGFGSLLVSPLKRINLIAGKNNAGKTALLEAIHLMQRPTDCSNPVKVNQFRGLGTPDSAIQEICNWLFFGGDPRNVVEFHAQDSAGVTRLLTIRLVDAATSMREHQDAEEFLATRFHQDVFSGNSARLILKFEQPGHDPILSVGIARDNGMAWFSADVGEQSRCRFLPSMISTSAEDVRSFGEIELNKRQDEILVPLRMLEPRLLGLRLIPLGQQPVIHGDIGLKRMIPLAMLGEGMRRLLSIVLAIATAEGGTVLIDEIENGLHYSVLPLIWGAIAIAAERMNAQIFATTHSWECLEAARSAFAGQRESELAVHRLERDASGNVKAVTMDYKAFETAIDLGWEVR